MALSFSGSGQYITQGTAVVTALPLTLACWFKPTSTAANGTLISISANSTANSYFMMVMIAGGSIRAQQSTAGTAVNASTGNVFTAGTWYHCAAVFASATSRTIYVNGVAVTNATSNAGGTVNVTAIGTNFQGSATALNVLNGTIAYPAIWNIALGATDINNLYNAGSGVDPNAVQSGRIVSFSFLQGSSPFPDSVTSNNWTLTGAPAVVSDPFNIAASFPQSSGIGTRFGFATHFSQGWPSSLMPLIAETGATYIRDNLTTNGSNGWEPSTGVFQVSTTDKVWIDIAHANGLKVVGIMGGNNLYPTNQFYDPTLIGNRAKFIAQSGLVDVIEVLNEPNNAYQSYEVSIGRNWLTDLPLLTTAVTNSVNAVSSIVQVIGLGAQGSEIWSMYPSTTLDGVVYHPYDTGASHAVSDLPDTCYEQPVGVNSTSSLVYAPWIVICRSQTSLPLWETEWGVQQPDTLGGFTQDNQSDYLVRRLLTAAGLAVENTFIYEFMDNGSGDLFGVYSNSTTPKASYSAVANTISALSGTQGTPASKPTISNVASGSTNAMGYAYQGPGKTVASSWFGNASPSSPEPASTCTISFGTGIAYNAAIVLNPIAGSSVPLTTYSVLRSGNQVTVSGLPISDHPLLIILTESTQPRFLQRAINHVSGSGAISCPVTTSLTLAGNLLVVYIGTQAAGSVISSVTDNKGNAYSLAYSNTAFNASLLCYHCLGCASGVTTVTVISSASVNSLNLDVAVYEFSGGVGSDWFFDTDASAGSNSGGSIAVSSSPTPVSTQVNEVAVAACAAVGTTTTAGTGGGWTGVVSGLNGWSEYEIVSSAGTYSASFTVATTGHAWVAGIGTWYALNSSLKTNPRASSASSLGVIVVQMAPITDSFVQQAENSVANSGAISCGVSLSATQAGNLIVVYIGTLATGSVIASVTDNKANVYTLAFSDTAFNSSLFCYHCLGCIAGVTTVTVVSGAAVNSNQLDVSVYEISGTGTWALDKFSVSGSNSGATTAATSGTTLITTVSNEVVIGACFTNGTTVLAGTAGYTGQSA